METSNTTNVNHIPGWHTHSHANTHGTGPTGFHLMLLHSNTNICTKTSHAPSYTERHKEPNPQRKLSKDSQLGTFLSRKLQLWGGKKNSWAVRMKPSTQSETKWVWKRYFIGSLNSSGRIRIRWYALLEGDVISLNISRVKYFPLHAYERQMPLSDVRRTIEERWGRRRSGPNVHRWKWLWFRGNHHVTLVSSDNGEPAAGS